MESTNTITQLLGDKDFKQLLKKVVEEVNPTGPTQEDYLLKTKDVCRVMNLGMGKVLELVDTGYLPVIRIANNQFRYKLSDVRATIESMREVRI